MHIGILTFSALKEKIYQLGQNFAMPAAQPPPCVNSCHLRHFAG
jgi:hypothetical protein